MTENNLVAGIGNSRTEPAPAASFWQLIFFQSKANGGSYTGEGLPHVKWQWPRDTWFQAEMSRHLKALESATHQARN